MELMVQAGLTPMQVIQSFSKNAAQALGIDKDYGTLARGKAADLLVLERNPPDSITNMRTLDVIYLGGRKFERPRSLRVAQTPHRREFERW